jgi:hypothetical protein
MKAPPIAPQTARDRFDVYRFFNGMSEEAKAGLDSHYTRTPLVKTFLLEHVAARRGRVPRSPADILQGLGAETQPLDDEFHEVRVWENRDGESRPQRRTVGYVERYSERFFAYYTADGANEAKRLVERWVARSPDLDCTWFTSHFLHTLWNRDVSERGDDRFGKLIFRHESVFDMPTDEVLAIENDDTEEPADEDLDEDRPDLERRTVRSEIKDRIGPIRKVLEKLQDTYVPLNSLYGLRIPSAVGRGSHDLYQEGRITNRADTFEDHRNMVRYLYRTYRTVLEHTEQSAWFAFEQHHPGASTRTSHKGVPLIIEFKEPLSAATFERWISLAFRKRNVFRLWGNPIYLGPTKVHVYGADRHLWQPINLEMTKSRLVAVLPKGTCGNTFHRLVANVQRYVCPKVEVWLGETPFRELMESVGPAEPSGDAVPALNRSRD